jgi:hypothetical protein
LAQLSPRDLGERLDRWALRREKVLALIDVRAARHARRLAVACRVLANRLEQAQGSEREALALEWLELRAEVAALLAPTSSPPPSRS